MRKKLLLILFVSLVSGCGTLIKRHYFTEVRADRPRMGYRSEFDFHQDGYDVSIYSHYYEMRDFLVGPIIPFIPTFGEYYKACCGPVLRERNLEVGLIIASSVEKFYFDFTDIRVVINQQSLEGKPVENYDSKTLKSIVTKGQNQSRLAVVFRFPVKNKDIDSFTVEGMKIISEKGKVNMQPLNFKKKSGMAYMLDLPPG